MILNLSYPEMSFLREIVKEKQFLLWKTRFGSRFRKNITAEEERKAFEETMNKPLPEYLEPTNNIECAKRLLDKLQVLENECQAALRESAKKGG